MSFVSLAISAPDKSQFELCNSASRTFSVGPVIRNFLSISAIAEKTLPYVENYIAYVDIEIKVQQCVAATMKADIGAVAAN